VYASHVRRLWLSITFPLALGCRPPNIPAQPKPQEYAVYTAWLEQESSSSPHQLSFAVDSATLPLQQNELQFRQCLPRRMEAIFDSAPAADLTASSSNDWITLSDGRPTRLHPHGTGMSFDHPTQLFRVSRVAFTRFGYDAYLWVERWTCGTGDDLACKAGSGALVHGRKSNGSWSFEDTNCQIIVLGH